MRRRGCLQQFNSMIQIHNVSLVFLMVAVAKTFTAPVKDPHSKTAGKVEVVYHVGDIAEHAYNHETWNTYLHSNPPPEILPKNNSLNGGGGHSNNHNVHRQPATGSVPHTALVAAAAATATTPTTTTARPLSSPTFPTTATTTTITMTTPQQDFVRKSAAQAGTSMSTGAATPRPDLTVGSGGSGSGPPGSSAPSESSERNLEAFLAMLDETRTAGPAHATLPGEHRMNPTASHLPALATVPHPLQLPPAPILPSLPNPAASSSQQEWAVYDDLDTQESNQTAVIASNQKFGYIVHGNNFRRFRVEEKNANGLITGLFGVHHNNGRFRGVQYAADPASINPKFLYDTLVKFLSL